MRYFMKIVGKIQCLPENLRTTLGLRIPSDNGILKTIEQVKTD